MLCILILTPNPSWLWLVTLEALQMKCALRRWEKGEGFYLGTSIEQNTDSPDPLPTIYSNGTACCSQ
jgi:hypothetical protein